MCLMEMVCKCLGGEACHPFLKKFPTRIWLELRAGATQGSKASASADVSGQKSVLDTEADVF